MSVQLQVTLSIDGVLYLRVIDAYKASYGVEDPEFAITQLAQTTMRSELGKISLDSVFKERESLNIGIVDAINKASSDWGISCLRYEIRDIKLPDRVQEAMQMQVEAERKKRAQILDSEGTREAEINVAEGQKRARVLASEALKFEITNRALGNFLSTLLLSFNLIFSLLQVKPRLLLRSRMQKQKLYVVLERHSDLVAQMLRVFLLQNSMSKHSVNWRRQTTL